MKPNTGAGRQKLILASGSPRRKALLSGLGFSFETVSPDVDEHTAGDPWLAVAVLARRKAMAAARVREKGIILAADTLVALGSKALGKPADREEARSMLESLSGRAHDVYTGVCILDAETGLKTVHVERTGVRFRELGSEEIERYLDTGEPMDKAGAYGIQGSAGAFVQSISGSYENVMGLPVGTVRLLLSAYGMRPDTADAAPLRG